MITESVTINKYKEIMTRLLRSSYPWMNGDDLSNALNYSVNKRYKQFTGSIYNNYTNKRVDKTVLEMCDYIASREPIITSYGVLFKRHEDVPNPLGKVIQSFMDLRGVHKNEMFKYPKGSEMFERFNLLQNLDKIDCNGIYGLAGLFVSIIYNLNVAPSITSMGRSLISSAIMCFEMFLANNVKFASLNDILTFIDNVRMEASQWKYDDYDVLDKDKFVSVEECFFKIMYNCGYKYIPDERDMDIVWNIIQNCDQRELNRLYYKNNLYSFMDNSKMQNLIREIIGGLKTPYMEAMKPPKEIIKPLNELRDLLLEYVFYCYQIMDRMDRNKNMVKNVSIISDTDSSFVSLDAWFNYTQNIIKDMDCDIMHQKLDVINYIKNVEKEIAKEMKDQGKSKDEIAKYLEENRMDATHGNLAFTTYDIDDWGDPINEHEHDAIEFLDNDLDYDFFSDRIIEIERSINPVSIIPQDNVRFSLINIMAYILDAVINRYMIDFTKQSHSYRGDDKCRIIMKNEFFMYRVLMTQVKKHYAALQGVQEGKFLGEDGSLDIKGIDCMAKSTFAKSTRDGLKKILLEDILKPDAIDQLQVIKDVAIMEQTIYQDVLSGSKKYYKPLTVKSASHYADPFTEQGIKGSIVWNYVRDPGLSGLDLGDRNGVDIAKVNITPTTIEKIKETHPDEYAKLCDLVDTSRYVLVEGKPAKDVFKGNITSVAIPKDVAVPDWLLELIDIDAIISDNLAGFPLESIGVSKLDSKKGVVYTNMIKL